MTEGKMTDLVFNFRFLVWHFQIYINPFELRFCRNITHAVNDLAYGLFQLHSPNIRLFIGRLFKAKEAKLGESKDKKQDI